MLRKILSARQPADRMLRCIYKRHSLPVASNITSIDQAEGPVKKRAGFSFFSTQVQTSWQKEHTHDDIHPSNFPESTEFLKRRDPNVISGGENDKPRTSVLMELTDHVGVLHDVLKLFWKFDVNVTRIESRPAKPSNKNLMFSSSSSRHQEQEPKRFDFFVDFDGQCGVDQNVDDLLACLGPITEKLLVLDEKKVHWFPRHISELDKVANRTLDAGTDLESDHPGFHDVEYRQRRYDLAKLAKNYTWDQDLPLLEYTEKEVATWGRVWEKMEPLWEKYACSEYKDAMEQMKQHCNYGPHSIPQQRDISTYLQSRTNFRMRPVAGLLSSRDFLNGLAFRVFFSTSYLRHDSKPLYTPEPDLCHELLGHAPMFANQDFADFSQELGLASLGASEEEVVKLARCYWHSVEFGLCLEDGQHKAYGAGLLSSFGELEYACAGGEAVGDVVVAEAQENQQDNDENVDHVSDVSNGLKNDGFVATSESKQTPEAPEIKPWDPRVAAVQEFPITTYQPVYFLATSLEDAKNAMRSYCEELPRPFFAVHNAETNTISIDRPVRRAVGLPLE